MARKILLADDSVTAQNMGRKILVDAGYEVIAVNNGSAALKKIAELKPDLVILDVYMPGYSGLEVCQRLKESPETARIPVLLTVGKLEPFKPEEAQRVRAEGFIVKPFEASELLSTLSKLEDKVVPRAEPSKPGRFARAIAAAEETERGGRDEAPSADSTDTGWKSRIGFPKKKTETEEKAADEAPVYTPSVAETPLEKAAERIFKREQGAEAGGTRADLAGTAAAGLPKDVTPEEFAAIAAVAAQMQAASAALKDEPVSPAQTSPTQTSPTQTSPIQAAAAPIAETPSHASLEPASQVHSDFAPRVEVEATTETPAEDHAENKKEESKPDNVAGPAAATQIYRRRKDDVIPEETQDLPVTMAATAESVIAASAGRSRWTAVSVALEGSESAISLDQEMQKAHAALASADSAPASGGNSFTHAESMSQAPAVISNPEPEPVSERVMNVAPAEAAPAPSETVASASSFATSEPVGASVPASASSWQSEPMAPSPITAEVASVEVPAETFQNIDRAEPTQASAAIAEAVSPVAEPEVITPVVSGAQEPRSEAEPAVGEAAERTPERTPEQAPEQAPEPRLDSEVVKTTAAAWANWRQTRDTGNGAEEAQPKEVDLPQAESADTAAMAVAAGAEQIAQEVSSAQPSGDSNNVASIVDSVLADLRPKLMEEISRKMSKKK